MAAFTGIDMAKSKSPRKQYAPKQKLSREQANKLIYSTIFRASTQPISGEQIMALILPFRARLSMRFSADGLIWKAGRG